MHDVLGHRLSLLGMHAGALEYRPDASPAELAAAAGTVPNRPDWRSTTCARSSACCATKRRPTAPQPTLVDLPALVAESTEAGMRVDAYLDVTPRRRRPVGTPTESCRRR